MALRRAPKKAAGGLVAPGSGGVSSKAAPTPTPVVERDSEWRRLGEVLIAQDVVTQEDVDAALAIQEESGVRLGEILQAEKLVTADEMVAALAEQFGLAVVDLGRLEPEVDTVALLEESVARSLHVVPIRPAGGGYEVVTSDPAQPDLVDSVQAAMGAEITLVLSSPADVDRVTDRVYRAVASVGDAIKVFETRASERIGAEAAAADTSQVDVNAPIVQVVTMILSQAVRDRASDVHIEPMGSRVRVRNRIDGALHEVLSLPQSMAQALVSRIKIMADMNIVERRRPQDGQ
ncbi:MAG TPA: ATPase, T2SS/T4P/T4SS family, partial [Acidimicrobiales bacterium]